MALIILKLIVMNCSEAKDISIIDFLAKNGYSHVLIKGQDYWYKSPLRDEHTPSFKVNPQKNLWFDFGMGEGGDIIKLVCILFKTTHSDSLKILSNNNYSISAGLKPTQPSSIQIESVRELSNIRLLQYLRYRKIDISIAEAYCREIDFWLNQKKYYAIGFKNNSGGYELRNKYFKGCTTPKDITYIHNNSNKILVFEGFMDFLSWFSCGDHTNDNYDFLILNSLALLNRGKNIIEGYYKGFLFLDNDTAGKKASNELMEASNLRCVDMSTRYSEHKDLNHYLTSKQ
jgi:hypothetical protein